MTAETNAERLERIKKEQWYVQLIDVGNSAIDLDDFNWLFQQAERAQELGDYASKSANFINQVELEKENARLRKALEFYAGNGHYELWQERDGTPLTNEWTNDVTYDGGVTARTALNIQEDSR